MATIISKKLKISIIDLTDCEGCELEFVNLGKKLADIADQTNIADWRFASRSNDKGNFDLTFIEGSPITETDIERVKRARVNSKLIVTLGSCAELGGIQGYLSETEWTKGIKEVYGEKYKTKSKPPKPVSYYINVDYHLPGCPINPNELANFLSAIIVKRKPSAATYPVCLECKAKETTCLLLEGQPCLGPITKGGCEAVCPEKGLRCWGCFGPLKGGNPKALKNFFDEKFGKERTRTILSSFYSQKDEFKALYLNEKTVKKEKKMKVEVKSGK